VAETAKIPVEQPTYRFKLFVSGMSIKSVKAIENLKAICDAHLPGRFYIETIDISVNKEFAVQYQIVAIPTLIKTEPTPVRTIVGDLSDKNKVLTILEIE
jgi:circadian clock protein KaiB